MGEEGGLPEDVVCPAVGIRGQGKPEFREVECATRIWWPGSANLGVSADLNL
jgi:hypothetical protein